MIKFLRNIANIYTSIWCIYILQGVLYTEGGLLSRVFFILLMLMSVYYVFYANLYYKLPPFFKALNILLILVTLYGGFRIINGEQILLGNHVLNSVNYLKAFWISLLPIYSYFTFTKKGNIDEKWFENWFIIFLLVITLSFFRTQREVMKSLFERGFNVDEVTNNAGYIFVSLIPMLVFLWKKPIIQYMVLAYIMAFVIISMKRGAILCGCFCIVYFLMSSFNNYSKKRKILILILSLLTIIAGYLFVEHMFDTNDSFANRFIKTKEGDSSGRDRLFGYFIEYFFNKMTPLQSLCGLGADGTLTIYYNYAHNDWLEIAIDQGWLGLIIFLFYWVSYFRAWRVAKGNHVIFLALGLLFIFSFVRTFFSMSINDMYIYETSVLGYCLASTSVRRIKS